MSSHGALVVFGSGPGVGRNVAAFFAERGFKTVVLMSRDATRLAEDAAFVRSSSTDVRVIQIPMDLSDDNSRRQGLIKLDESLSGAQLECVLFNAARLGKSEFFKFDATSLEDDLRISVTSLYAVAQWAMPKLLEFAKSSTATPSLLVTSGMLAKDPSPLMFSLAACKAAQYNLVHSLHKEFEPKGVHCGLIVIAGKVAEESKGTNPKNIADSAWKMFETEQTKGDLEVVIMDPAFAEHVKNRGR